MITFYIWDAAGNVLSTYEKSDINNGDLTQKELHLYGSCRLGILNTKTDVQVLPAINGITTFERADKYFELNNHLGNVFAVVSDKIVQHTANNTSVDYFNAELVSANDYYPFGMAMPGRKFNIDKAVYGFNGKRKDNDIYGEGNAYDFGDRIYSPRLGRWLAVDMAAKKSPGETPYRFGHNNPLRFLDPDGSWEEDGHF